MSNEYNKKMIKLLSETYNERLKYFLEEVDAYDKKGNPILGSASKLTHEESGFVYTVLGYKKINDKDYIALRLPDEPRIGLDKPQKSNSLVIEDDVVDSIKDEEISGNNEVYTSADGDYKYILVSIDKIKSDYKI